MPVITGLLIGLLMLSSCIALDRGDRADVHHQAMRNELLELVKSYRICLQKYEDHPTNAKEICTGYRDAIHDLVPSHNERRSITELLERLLEKGR